jgi:formate dehydrogenase major subunit
VAKVSDAVNAGELFATFQSPDAWVNHVTSMQRDRFVQTPEYKLTAVRIDVSG